MVKGYLLYYKGYRDGSARKSGEGGGGGGVGERDGASLQIPAENLWGVRFGVLISESFDCMLEDAGLSYAVQHLHGPPKP